MDHDTMRRRVDEARVGRLATIRPDGTPHLVPICFAMISDEAGGDVLVSVTDDKPKTTYSLQRLKNVVANPSVTLLIDHYEEEWGRVWWIRVDGEGRIIDDRVEQELAVDALRAKYEQYRNLEVSGAVLAIDARRWRGWAYDEG